MKHARSWWLLPVAAVGVTGGAWLLADQSGPQRAAVTEPELSVLTVPVESREAEPSIVVRSDVGFAGEEQVALVEPPESVTRPVATALPAAQSEVGPGELLFELSGTPVFLLQGRIAPYRTILPGDTGVDVRQLQEALSSRGLYSGTVDGEYGPATIAAFERLYSDQDYPPPSPSDEALAELESAETELAALEAPQAASTAADGDSGSGPTASQLANARQRVSDARFGVGTPVPIYAVHYTAQTPVTVTGLDVAVGDVIEGPVLRVSAGALEARAQVGASIARTVEAGMHVVLQEAVGAPEFSAVVDRVIESADAEGGAGATIVIRSEESLADLNGKNVRAEIMPISVGDDADPILVVPASALTTRENGRTVVVVVVNGDLQREVEVTAGTADAEGMVAIRPLSGSLAAGDFVVVGVQGE